MKSFESNSSAGIGATGNVWYGAIGDSSGGSGTYAIVSGSSGRRADQLRVRRHGRGSPP